MDDANAVKGNEMKKPVKKQVKTALPKVTPAKKASPKAKKKPTTKAKTTSSKKAATVKPAALPPIVEETAPVVEKNEEERPTITATNVIAVQTVETDITGLNGHTPAVQTDVLIVADGPTVKALTASDLFEVGDKVYYAAIKIKGTVVSTTGNTVTFVDDRWNHRFDVNFRDLRHVEQE